MLAHSRHDLNLLAFCGQRLSGGAAAGARTLQMLSRHAVSIAVHSEPSEAASWHCPLHEAGMLPMSGRAWADAPSAAGQQRPRLQPPPRTERRTSDLSMVSEVNEGVIVILGKLVGRSTVAPIYT